MSLEGRAFCIKLYSTFFFHLTQFLSVEKVGEFAGEAKVSIPKRQLIFLTSIHYLPMVCQVLSNASYLEEAASYVRGLRPNSFEWRSPYGGVMLGASIVVRAAFSGNTLTKEYDPTSYEFEEGEIGILGWINREASSRFFEPTVVWDTDPEKTARRVGIMTLEIIGIEVQGVRFYYQPVPVKQDPH